MWTTALETGMMMTTNEIRDMSEEGASFFAEGRYQESIAAFSRTIERDPECQSAYLSRGAAHLQIGEAKNALLDLNKALELDGQKPRAYHLRGLAHHALKEYEQALAVR